MLGHPSLNFVTKDPLPTNPLAAVKCFITIIKIANVFEFGGSIRNFFDKQEIPIGRNFSIEIKFGFKDSKGNQGTLLTHSMKSSSCYEILLSYLIIKF